MEMINFVKKEEVKKGWSSDKKYCVTASDGTKYLLRVSDASKQKRAREVFEYQKQVAALGVPMCLPLECGECDEGFYLLQTWVNGQDAGDVIPTLSPKEQYQYGLDAGRILKKLHTLPAPPDARSWDVFFNAKMDRKIAMYNDCPIKVSGAEHFIDYIQENRRLLGGRPQCLQHGDYHIGNMMIEDGKLVIIDFDRFDVGDPWEEFNRIVWCAQASYEFASGMVDGYFDGAVPLEFWKLLALYISSNTLSSIPWAIPFGEGEVQKFIAQTRDVLCWYDNMQTVVPFWYKNQQ